MSVSPRVFRDREASWLRTGSAAAACVWLLSHAGAQERFFDPSFDVAGHAGVRFASPDDDVARVDGGFGKFRFGGDGERDADAQIGEIAVELDARLNDWFGVVLHAQHQPEQSNAVDIVEGYFLAEPRLSDSLSLIVKGGAFFPGLSKENRGVGWSNTYTITNSAANTWIGEDIRSFGTTVGGRYTGDAVSASIEGGLFFGNDVPGAVLTFGGWSLNDLKTPIFGENQVPLLESDDRAPAFDPFQEIDGRAGFQIKADFVSYALGGLTLVYWDNRGDINQSRPDAVVWDTRFFGATAEFTLPYDISFLPALMIGETATPAVNNEFWTISALFSRYFGPVQAAFRAEYFEQDDKIANNGVALGEERGLNFAEEGFALTAAARYNFGSRHEFLAEIIHQQTDRASGATTEPIDLQETQIQLGYRVAF